MVSCVSFGFLRVLDLPVCGVGRFGAGWDCLFPEDTGSSFSSDRDVKAVCAVLEAYGRGL